MTIVSNFSVTPPGIPVSDSRCATLDIMPDEKTLRRLYAVHRNPLHRFISKKMKQHDEAEDVVQETFVRLSNKESTAAKGLAAADSPVAYLYRIASNLAIDRLRQQKAHCDEGDKLPIDDSIQSPQPTLSHQIVSSEQLLQLEVAVGNLPMKCRQVFVLHKFRQMKYREVARHLDISVSAVEKHMMKALTRLQEELESIDYESQE